MNLGPASGEQPDKRCTQWIFKDSNGPSAESRSGDAFDLSKIRTSFLWKWSNRAKKLAFEEKELHASLPDHLKSILEGKRLLLTQEILDALNYPDKRLVDDIRKAFTLHGWLPESNIFTKDVKRPEFTVETALELAKGIDHAIFKQVKSSGDPMIDDETWSKTLEEIERGWIWQDDSDSLDGKLLATRFWLQQKNQLRLIDNCSIGAYNRTCGASEKVKLHAIDDMAAYLTWVQTNCKSVHVVGKTYDLLSANKQYEVCSETRELLRILVYRPTTRARKALGVNALPFGATASVTSFLRISLAVWYIGMVGLHLPWVSFSTTTPFSPRKQIAEALGWRQRRCSSCWASNLRKTGASTWTLAIASSP